MSSVRIRLQRFGRLHKPFYRIVACPRKTSRDGKFHEILGTYNPIPDREGNKQVSLKTDRIKYWMMVGAEPSERVSKILGIAEVLPPAPRRSLPYLTMPEAAASDSDAAASDEDDVVDDAGASDSAESPEGVTVDGAVAEDGSGGADSGEPGAGGADSSGKI